MRPGRTLVAALLVGLALTALVGGWGITGLQAVSTEAEQLSLRPHAEARRRAGELAAELAARLEEVRAAEDARPYYEYQNLFHDPRGASQGQSVALSPLARGSEDPLVAVHFQRGADGAVTVPTVNEEVPELSDASRAAADRARLGALRAAAGQLAAHDVLVALAAAPQQANEAPPQQQAAQVQNFEPDVYAQNLVPNQVYRDVQQQRAPMQKRAPAEPTIAVRTEPLVWRTVALDGRPHLVAVRGVGTPDGTLSQGFALSPDGLAAWIAERQGDLPARLVPGAADDAGGAEAALPLAGAAWTVEVDPTPAMAAADADGRALRRGFLLRVVPVAALALLCGVLVVLLVARAERLARQRSGFAAAAAHELRTPLAGLALYGDMLADGLGDPAKRADYARRVSDEASRLGRGVGNVLGFTQLERRSLAVAPRAGDAARLTRDALERMRPALEHAGVALRADLPDEAAARFDEDAAHRILQNLLDNAEKYTRSSDRTVTVTVRRAGGRVLIDVSDRGPGVAPRVKLFQAFARGEADGGPAGLGLGLALSRAQARAMGGDLTHAARDGGGSTFTLELPAG